MNLKVILFFLFIALNCSISEAKTYNELYDIVNNSTSLSKKQLIILQQKEIQEAILKGDYSHVLHATYLEYESNHRFKKINPVYEIKQLFHLMQISKRIDHQMYFASSLNHSRYILSQSIRISSLEKLMGYCKKYKLSEKQLELYSELGDTYYLAGKYDFAIKYWRESLKIVNSNLHLKKSSLLNNISCAYDEKKVISKAMEYNRKAIIELDKIKNKTEYENDFKNALIGNYGLYCMNKGDYKIAQKFLKLNYDYIIQSKKATSAVVNSAKDIFQLGEFINTKNDYKIVEIEERYSRVNNITTKIEFLVFFIDYFKKYTDYKKLTFYQEELIEVKLKEKEEHLKRLKLINSQLTQEKINEVKAKNATKLEIQKSKALINYLILIFILVIFALLLYFKLKNISRDTKIILQAKDLELAKNEALENELKYQKESNINLQLNLEIKKKSDVIFMDKLKEIRRKKNNDPEELIKELQLQIMNMLQIDNKNATKGKVKSKEESEFKTILQGLNKNLSEQEIRLCAYFKMNLSNKEISQLEQHLAVTSIRVLKNRIKNKLELGADVKLNDYLNGLC